MFAKRRHGQQTIGREFRGFVADGEIQKSGREVEGYAFLGIGAGKRGRKKGWGVGSEGFRSLKQGDRVTGIQKAPVRAGAPVIARKGGGSNQQKRAQGKQDYG